MELIHYNCVTGEFTRLPRKVTDFTNSTANEASRLCAAWNARWAGKQAGGDHPQGYISIRVGGEKILAHQVAWIYMTGVLPKADIDHINGNKKDNSWVNLRLATRSQNKANVRKPITNSSGYKGVSYSNTAKKWVAQIGVDGKTFVLGYFLNPIEAHAAYVAAAERYFGVYANAG
jgi:hypothetical protein